MKTKYQKPIVEFQILELKELIANNAVSTSNIVEYDDTEGFKDFIDW